MSEPGKQGQDGAVPGATYAVGPTDPDVLAFFDSLALPEVG